MQSNRRRTFASSVSDKPEFVGLTPDAIYCFAMRYAFASSPKARSAKARYFSAARKSDMFRLCRNKIMGSGEARPKRFADQNTSLSAKQKTSYFEGIHHVRSTHHLPDKANIIQKTPFVGRQKTFFAGGSGGIRTHEPVKAT